MDYHPRIIQPPFISPQCCSDFTEEGVENLDNGLQKNIIVSLHLSLYRRCRGRFSSTRGQCHRPVNHKTRWNKFRASNTRL